MAKNCEVFSGVLCYVVVCGRAAVLISLYDFLLRFGCATDVVGELIVG